MELDDALRKVTQLLYGGLKRVDVQTKDGATIVGYEMPNGYRIDIKIK